MIVLLGTGNPGKLLELRSILGEMPGLRLLTRHEVPFPDVEETGASFAENALIKARTIASATGCAVLAEDSGLCVRALRGDPGVRSARYAGEPSDHEANLRRLLERMRGVDERTACFVTVAALRFRDGKELLRAGVLTGRIAEERAGCGGFGYDPVFVPDGHVRTLAQLPADLKNRISHRRRAVEPLRELLSELCRREALR